MGFGRFIPEDLRLCTLMSEWSGGVTNDAP
jgi:hypothetical protein